MKVFNTIVNIILIIAVAFLFWKTYQNPTASNNSTATEANVQDSLNAQGQGVRIAYINSDSLVSKYDYHKDLKTKLEAKAKKLEDELANKSQAFQENVKTLQAQADKMTQQQLAAAQQDLQQTQQTLMSYRDQKSQELADEQQKLTDLIQADIEDILQQVKKDYNLDFILSYDPNGSLLAANKKYDITDIVVKRLNDKYAQKDSTNTKNNTK